MSHLKECCHSSVAKVRFLLLRGNYVINLVSTSHRNMTDSRQQIASSSELFCYESALFLLTIIGKCTQHMYITAQYGIQQGPLVAFPTNECLDKAGSQVVDITMMTQREQAQLFTYTSYVAHSHYKTTKLLYK